MLNASIQPAEPVQKRAVRTRRLILEAAEAIAASRGADAVTTTAIASEAGISVGSVYRYFADRDALLIAAYDQTVLKVIDASADEIAAISAKVGIREAISLATRYYLNAAVSVPAHLPLLRESQRLRQPGLDPAEVVDTVTERVFAPIFARAGVDVAKLGGVELKMLYLVLANLVDFWLVTDNRADRGAIEAALADHAILAFERIAGSGR